MVSPEDMEWGTPHCKTHTSGEVGIWISTEEEPPEIGEEVFVYGLTKEIITFKDLWVYDKDRVLHLKGNRVVWQKLLKVKYWMRIPDLPESDS